MNEKSTLKNDDEKIRMYIKNFNEKFTKIGYMC